MTLLSIFIMILMAFCQSVSFSIVSRSRNRNSKMYHFIAAILSNGVWFMTLKYLAITNGMNWQLFVPYTIGTVGGSVTGQSVSMWIEKKLNIGVE